MLDREGTLLVVIDVQERLVRAMPGREGLLLALCRLIRGARVLEVPIVWTEQNPDGLGPTAPEIADLMPDLTPIPKFSFSCCGEQAVMDALAVPGRRQVLLAGIEAHVCVYQTAADLVARGFEVQVVSDAVSSRTAENRQVGLERARQAGASITSVETALFELLKVARGPQFKEILDIVK